MVSFIWMAQPASPVAMDMLAALLKAYLDAMTTLPIDNKRFRESKVLVGAYATVS